jgi:hypothetical protein
MRTKTISYNIRMSEADRARTAELARRLKIKESVAIRVAVAMALEQTDPKKNPDVWKNIVVIS